MRGWRAAGLWLLQAHHGCARSGRDPRQAPRGPIAQVRRSALTNRLSPRSWLARPHRHPTTQRAGPVPVIRRIDDRGGRAGRGHRAGLCGRTEASPSMWSQIKSSRRISDKLGPQIESHAKQPSGWRDQSQGSAQSDAAEGRFLESARSARRSWNAQARRELSRLMRERARHSVDGGQAAPFVEGRASKNSGRTVRYEAQGAPRDPSAAAWGAWRAPPSYSPALVGEVIGDIRQRLAGAQ